MFEKERDKKDISDESDTRLCTPLLSIVVYQLPILAYLNDSRSAVIFRHAAGVYHEAAGFPYCHTPTLTP